MSTSQRPAPRTQNRKPSIWVEFNKLASESKAVNLGQGFPDTPVPKFVANALRKCADHPEISDFHQYSRGYGHLRLVKILADMYGRFYGRQINGNEEIMVTCGAQEALFCSIHGWISQGDEVIIIEPAYDVYSPQIKMAGGKPVPIVMDFPKNGTNAGQFSINFDEMEAKINKNTKMIVLNNPNNPTGKLFRKNELLKIAELAKKYDLLVVADEVYEFHVWNKDDMIRFASLPEMYQRTISIGSAGKAFSATGWRLGWAIGPADLLQPLKAVHQDCVSSPATPAQHAVADALEEDWPKFEKDPDQSHLATGLAKDLIPKRDRLEKMLKAANFQPIIPEAGYFMLANFESVSQKCPDFGTSNEARDFVFSKWLCREKRLAVIPPSAFYSDEKGAKENSSFIRICFFKKEETLDAAEKILRDLK